MGEINKMKFPGKVLIFLLIIFVILQNCAAKRQDKSRENSLKGKWLDFKKKFTRKYTNLEEHTRQLRFEKINDAIEQHNREFEEGKQTYKKGHNHFSDLFEDELSKILMNLNQDELKMYEERKPKRTQAIQSTATVPDSMNWVEKGWNTPVQNQGNCGSCYSFAAIGTIEAALFIKNGTKVKLSEQDPIDCSGLFGNFGCIGGMPSRVFSYSNLKGVSAYEKYPYKGRWSICLKSGNQLHVSDYKDVPMGDEEALKNAVATNGPIAVAIDATNNFMHYASGIFDDPTCSSEKVTHAVILVGYGTEDGTDYWLIKNSWGPEWGENGYIRMRRNNNNQCGISNYCSYPIL